MMMMIHNNFILNFMMINTNIKLIIYTNIKLIILIILMIILIKIISKYLRKFICKFITISSSGEIIIHITTGGTNLGTSADTGDSDMNTGTDDTTTSYNVNTGGTTSYNVNTGGTTSDMNTGGTSSQTQTIAAMKKIGFTILNYTITRNLLILCFHILRKLLSINLITINLNENDRNNSNENDTGHMSASHDTGHMSASPDSSGLLVLVISLSEVQIGIGTSHITSGTSNGYGTSNSSNSYGTTNSNSSGGTNTNTLKIAEKIKLLFHDNYSRLFGFQLHIKNITIRSKDMSKVWESKNNSISLLFSNNQLGQLQSGLLIQVNQVFAKVSKLLLDQINGKSIVNNANGNIDSITEKVTKKLQLIMSKSSIITTFIPSIVICSSQTNLSIPMENKSADYNQGNLSLEEASIVLKSSRKGKSLDLSANIRIDYCSLTVFPKESQICDVKSFTFWNEFHINEMIPEFPFYLPIKLEAESFLTMISPTLTLHDEFLLSIAIWLQKNKQNKANHSVFSFENALLDLLKIKARIHLIEYDANLTIIPLKQQDLDFLLKAKGKQLFLSLSSKSEHGNTLLHEFPKGVVTITIEHSQNFITASTVQSPLGLDSPTKYKGPAQLLSIPSSSLSVTFTSDFQLNGSVTVESILIDLAGIARDTLLYESILMKLLYNHAVLKSYDTPNGQNNEKSNSGNGYNENVVVSNNNDNNAASQETPTLSFVDVFKQKNIGLNLECHVNKFSITLSSMLHPFHSLTLIAKRIRGRMIKFDELFSQLDLDEVLLQIVPANFYVASCLDLKTVRVKQQDPTSPIRCVIQESNIHIDISKIYVLIKCMSFITHLHNIIVKNITPLFPTPPPVFEENNLKDLPRFSLCFPNLKIRS